MKKITLLYFTIVVSSLFFSCEELTLFPENRITDGSFWNSSNDFQLAVNSLYSSLPGHGIADVDSDIAFSTTPNNISSGTNLVAETDGVWNGAYANIRNVNNIIFQSEARPEVDAERWVGEAYFFRAFQYFRLLQRFGGVPIVTAVLDTDSEELFAPRNSRAEVVNLILDDLNMAASRLPLTLPTSEFGRITSGAALALKARVALFEGTWNKYNGGSGDSNMLLNEAISAANQVINSGVYELFQDFGADSYRKMFLPEGDDSKESILHRRYYADIQTHDFANGVQRNWSGTRKLMDMYLDNTGLPIDHPDSNFSGYDTVLGEFENRDARLDGSIAKYGDEFADHDGNEYIYEQAILTNYTVTGYRVRKFQSEDPAIRLARREFFDKHIIRYAEVLLILAEATFENNGSVSDEVLNNSINLLRDRAFLPHLTNSFVSTNNLNMLAEIRRERTVELAFEGFRLYDLKRWGIAVTELTEDVKGFHYTGTEWETDFPNLSGSFPSSSLDNDGVMIVQPASTRFFAERNLLWPLPIQQIQLNDSLEQNPGW